MRAKSIKTRFEKPIWNTRGFTKPNGVFDTNQQNQKTFIPRNLPPSFTYDSEFVMLLADAERKVGELKGKGGGLANPHILISAYLKQEAVLSSKIEGTLASLEHLNKHEAAGSIGKDEADFLRLREVVNYVNALKDAQTEMRKTGRVTLDLILNAHRTLFANVREDKTPGEFRRRQNWIVKTAGARSKIIYTPPPAEKLGALLDSLQAFIQSRHDEIPALIQCAMIHYQFEAIHPFLDGNGRIGRLILSLILYEKGLLPQPLLYLSAYFDRHRQEYYSGLLYVSLQSKWDDWIKFFLKAFAEQSDETIKGIRKLTDLQKRYKIILKEQTRSSNALLLMERLFENPYITIPGAAKFLKISYPAAKKTVMALVDAEILIQTDAAYKGKVFLANEIERNLPAD